jgi:hypothetical protein
MSVWLREEKDPRNTFGPVKDGAETRGEERRVERKVS